MTIHVALFLGFWVMMATTTNAYTPEVSHRHIAGLWKLTQQKSHHEAGARQQRYPIKEFTVFPKDKEKQRRQQQQQQQQQQLAKSQSQPQSILLMLKENGEFEEYSDDETKKDSIPETLRYHKADDAVLDRYSAFGRLKGNWELVDGKLILAPDRPTNETPSQNEDAVLEGEVVSSSEQGLVDNPALSSKEEKDQAKGAPLPSTISPGSAASSSQSLPSSIDTHLSVPKGRINVGRFMYPKHHPYFFDTPMYNPSPKGKFELKQVLGSLNTQQWNEEPQYEEKFKESDFYGKKFWLTSHPLKQQVPKGNKRWSIKYNRYVEDPPKKKFSDESNADKPVPTVNVLEVEFFQNNTFATIGGTGSSIILRGKFYVIGEKKDMLWCQIWRFGFGRSVSGSVYSEGTHLSKDDEKTYWGRIEYVEEEEEGDKGNVDPAATAESLPFNENRDNNGKLMVKGSVILGGNGLEPQPIGRFILTERTTNLIEDDEDDDDADDIDGSNDDQPFFGLDDAFQ